MCVQVVLRRTVSGGIDWHLKTWTEVIIIVLKVIILCNISRWCKLWSFIGLVNKFIMLSVVCQLNFIVILMTCVQVVEISVKSPQTGLLWVTLTQSQTIVLHLVMIWLQVQITFYLTSSFIGWLVINLSFEQHLSDLLHVPNVLLLVLLSKGLFTVGEMKSCL